MQIFDVVLRVPPLFVMDTVMNGSLVLSWLPDEIPLFGVVFFTTIAAAFFGKYILYTAGSVQPFLKNIFASALMHHNPTDTQRNNNVIIKSKRRCDVVLT